MDALQVSFYAPLPFVVVYFGPNEDWATVIVDPNTNLTLWESGAIIPYLIEQYDSPKKLTYDTLKEKHQLNQWITFQASTQGPYFAQSGWYVWILLSTQPRRAAPTQTALPSFLRRQNSLKCILAHSKLNFFICRFNLFHPEKLPSAIERYGAELKRILGVLERHLSGPAPREGEDGVCGPRQWLVGDKMTYADLAFVPWNHLAAALLPIGSTVDPLEEFPHVDAWHRRMVSRPAFRKCWALRERCMSEQTPSATDESLANY